MKHIIAMALIASQLMAGTGETLAAIVSVQGYKCDKVDKHSVDNWDGSYKLYCDDDAHAYRVKKVGTKWKVEMIY